MEISEVNMKVLMVVGARPNFMKAAPIVRAVERHNQRNLPQQDGNPNSTVRIQHVLVHTGQHYDKQMSDSFFADLQLPCPDVYLGVGSGSHAVQTAEVMRKFEEVVLQEEPDAVLVVGDVNSTIACALVTAKISLNSDGNRPLLAHVEAGLRSFDRTMPEEHNRVVTDHLSDVLFVTEPSGIENLSREGVAPERIHFVGNTMIDSLLAFRDKAGSSQILERLGLRARSRRNNHANGVGAYALLTLHRPANVDRRRNFLQILQGVEPLAAELPIIFPCHPRSQKRIAEFGLGRYFQEAAAAGVGIDPQRGIRITEPLGYLDFLCLMEHARVVLTDSGGIQEETTCLGVPCVTLRENTERPVTLTKGTNLLAGVTAEGIRRAITQQLQASAHHRAPEKWDGQAGERIVRVLLQETGLKKGFAAGNFSKQKPMARDPRQMTAKAESQI